jgi:hypothetical protein
MTSLSESTHEPDSPRDARHGHWAATIVAVLATYVLSSGPVMALGCRLRDATDWDGFYAVFYVYLPLLYPLADVDLFESYLMWWMKLFGTMPPG